MNKSWFLKPNRSSKRSKIWSLSSKTIKTRACYFVFTSSKCRQINNLLVLLMTMVKTIKFIKKRQVWTTKLWTAIPSTELSQMSAMSVVLLPTKLTEASIQTQVLKWKIKLLSIKTGWLNNRWMVRTTTVSKIIKKRHPFKWVHSRWCQHQITKR